MPRKTGAAHKSAASHRRPAHPPCGYAVRPRLLPGPGCRRGSFGWHSPSFSFALLAGFAKLPRPGVKPLVSARNLFVALPHGSKLAGQRRGVRAFHRPETAETSAVVSRAQSAAPGLRCRTQAHGFGGNGHTDVSFALAFHA